MRKYILVLLILALTLAFLGCRRIEVVNVQSNEPMPTPTNPTKPNLELIESNEETDDHGYKYIKGIIKNNTDKKYDFVSVEFNLYDVEWNLIGTAIAYVTGVESQTNWKFETTKHKYINYRLSEINGH